MLVMSDQTIRLTLRLALRERVGDALLDVLEEYLCRYPVPIKYTPDEINEQFGEGSNAYYRIFPEGFWNGKNISEVKKGTPVVWKNVPQGRNGGTSTKVEYVSGRARDWHDSEFLDI